MQPIAAQTVAADSLSGTDLYLSPLVKSIAQQENITEAELKSIKGSALKAELQKKISWHTFLTEVMLQQHQQLHL